MQRSAFRTNDSEPVRRQLAARPPLQLLAAAESARSDQLSVPLKARQRVGPTFLNFRKCLLRRGLHVLPGTFVCALHLLEELARFFGLLFHLRDGRLVVGLGFGSCLLKLPLIILDLRLPDIRLRLELIGKLLFQRHGLLLLVKFPSSIQITLVQVGSTRECSRYLRNMASLRCRSNANSLCSRVLAVPTGVITTSQMHS